MPQITCEVHIAQAPVPAIGIVHEWESGVTLFVYFGEGGRWYPMSGLAGQTVVSGDPDDVGALDPAIIDVLNFRLRSAQKPNVDLRPHMIVR